MKKEDLAKKMLEVVPPLLNLIRTEVRECAKPSLSVPQFRVLANINRGLNRTGDIAGHHGVSQPSMTKLVNNLVENELVYREHDEKDRRSIHLHLTTKGRTTFNNIKKQAYKKLAVKFGCLEESELDELLQLMDAAEKFLHKLLGERK